MRTSMILALGIAGLILNAQSSSESFVYLAKVEKFSVTKYITRAASQKFHYVLTRTPVTGSIESVHLKVPNDKTLVFTEGEGRGHCLDGFCLRLVDKRAALGGPKEDATHGALFVYTGDEQEISADLEFVNNTEFLTGRTLGFVETLVAASGDASEFIGALSGEKAINVKGDIIRERRKDSSRKLAREFLTNEYKKMGYDVREVPFSRGNYSGVNLVAEKTGAQDGFVIVSAHYDTVNSPGADDDASGVATSLLIAKALAGQPLKLGVRFVAFDLEEVGLVGSKEYATHLKQQGEIAKLRGVFHVEMTGFNPDGHNAIHVIDCNENTSAQLSELVMQSVRTQGLPLKRVDACTSRSDHAVFWNYNRPAIVVSQNFFGGDDNPCYHRTCDQIKSLDTQYLAQIAQAIYGAVAKVVLP